MTDSWKQYIEDPNGWKPPNPLPAAVTTQRVVVRLYQKGDGSNLFRAIDGARDRLQPQMVPVYTDHQDIDDSIHYVEKRRRSYEGEHCRSFSMGIFDRETGEILGGTGLHSIQSGRRQAELGYWIRGDRHGEGLCTEAAGALISAALRPTAVGGWGFRRLVVFNAADNVGSRRVCEKLGLRLEMRLKRERFFGPPGVTPGYVDVLGFAILDDEWDSSLHRAKQGIMWDEP